MGQRNLAQIPDLKTEPFNFKKVVQFSSACPATQGCQMAHTFAFQKSTNFVIFWKAFEWKIKVYF
jgi:hypothetical protein